MIHDEMLDGLQTSCCRGCNRSYQPDGAPTTHGEMGHVCDEIMRRLECFSGFVWVSCKSAESSAVTPSRNSRIVWGGPSGVANSHVSSLMEGEIEMLVLTRRKNETICVADNVEIRVLEVRGGRVRLGIEAPREIPVNRSEVLTVPSAVGAGCSSVPDDGGPADRDLGIAEIMPAVPSMRRRPR